MNNQIAARDTNPDILPEIKRARFDQLTIYEVSESELEILERGSPDSLYLNFSIFLLSSAITLTISLITLTILDIYLYTAFVVFAGIGYVVGILLLLLWWKSHVSVTKCIETIRKRLPPDGVQQKVQDEKDS